MPTYQYHCETCDTYFEYFKSMNADKPNCIVCNSEITKQVITGISFILKGGGWAKDLYERPNKFCPIDGSKLTKEE